MRTDKLKEALAEVMEEIEQALKDARGLLAHQRRLAFLLSLGGTILLELYLKKLDVIKEGSKINHLVFRKKKESILEALQNQIVTPITSLPQIDHIVELISSIEEKRDDLAYGSPTTEKVLQQKINLFFELKELVGC